jgi:hypothetical protein
MPCLNTQFDDLLRSAAPSLNQSTLVEHLSNQWIPRARKMVTLKIRYREAKRERAVAPDLKAVVVDCQTDRSSDQRVVAMAKGVDKGFAESRRRKQRLVHSLEAPRLDSACDRKMPPQELDSLVKQSEGVPVYLSLVQEFRFRGATESGHAKLALRIVRQERSSEQHHGGIGQL